jgi:hypothetical protein
VKALDEINYESNIINSLCDDWGVEKSKIIQTANRFFTDYKKFGARIKKLDQALLEYQIKFILTNSEIQVAYHLSDYENASIYISNMNNFCEELAKTKKGVIFYNEDFIYGMIGDPSLLHEENFKKFLDTNKKDGTELKYKNQSSVSVDKKKKINGIYQFTIFHRFNTNVIGEFFNNLKFTKI